MNHGERLVSDEEFEANDAERRQRAASRRAVQHEAVLDLIREKGRCYSRDVALALGITPKQASPMLREMEQAGLLVSSWVTKAAHTGAGRRYYRLPGGDG